MNTTNNSLKNYTSLMYRHTDEFGNNVCEQIENEIKQVVDREITLEQIPHPHLGVKVVYSQRHPIDGSLVSSMVLTEVDKNDSLINGNQMKVNYTTGKITFHHSLEGKYLNINYWGMGYNMIHASRIYTKFDEHGNIIETLDHMIQLIRNMGDADYILSILNQIENAKVSIINGVEYSEINERLNSIEQNIKEYLDDHMGIASKLVDVKNGIENAIAIANDVDYRMSVLENNYLNPNLITNSQIDAIIGGLV